MHLALLDRATGTSYDVWTKEGTIGRDPGCDVAVTGDAAKLASGKHARVFVADGKWWIEDSGSRNGTFVHGSKIEAKVRHALHKGVVIGLGATGTRLEVISTEANAAAAQTMIEGFAAPPPPTRQPSADPAPPPPARRPLAAGATMMDPGLGAALPKPPRAAPPSAGATMVDPGGSWEPGPQNAAPGDETSLHVVLRDQSSGQVHVFDAPIVRLGRSLDCDVHVTGEKAGSVSRVHSEILMVDGRVVLRDGGSRHGTLRNDKRLTGPSPLSRGDRITLGPGGPVFSVDDVTGGADDRRPYVPLPDYGRPEATAPDDSAQSATGLGAVLLRPLLGGRSGDNARTIRMVAYGILALVILVGGVLLVEHLRG